MAKISRLNSPLVTQPLKTSPGTGATLASLGFEKSIPLMHGSQGCGAFAKVYLIQHLREPIPLQNSAIDQVAAIMGGDENLFDALHLLCQKQQPEIITVITTGLTEMQGADTYKVIREFRQKHPEFDHIAIVDMQTPDFVGSMQTGFALTVDNIVRRLVQEPTGRKTERKQVNVLCSVGMTSADIEMLKRYLDAFELNAVVVPDLSLSLDGHLDLSDYSATSTGGTSVMQIEQMSESVLTLAFGESMVKTAEWLNQRFNIPFHYSELAMGIEDMDKLVMALARVSDVAVPEWINRSRKRLQDAMLDTHFLISNAKVAIALEPDLAMGYCNLLTSMGAEISKVITTIDSKVLAEVAAQEVVIGDLSLLTPCLSDLSLVISNTHAADICEPQVPVNRAGYPCHDQFGNMDLLQFGYEGSRQRLFAMANSLLQNHKEEVEPHTSVYRFSADEVKKTG